MTKYINELNDIIVDTITDINKLNTKYSNEDLEEKDRIASTFYTSVLNGLISFKDDVVNEVSNKCGLSNKDVKIVLNDFKDDMKNVDSSYVITDDPFIIETKSGKKIVLSEDPISYRTVTGRKIVLDKDPVLKRKKLVLDEDPISIETKSGRKIILDEDPVKNEIRSNNIAILESKLNGLYTPAPWSGYEDNIAFISDDDPFIIELPKGKKLVLDEDPISYNTSSGNRIVLDEDPIKSKGRLVLDEDPISINLKSGKTIVLSEDPVITNYKKSNVSLFGKKQSKGNKIVLDEDPISISVLD
jgi:hypothetical protein